MKTAIEFEKYNENAHTNLQSAKLLQSFQGVEEINAWFNRLGCTRCLEQRRHNRKVEPIEQCQIPLRRRTIRVKSYSATLVGLSSFDSCRRRSQSSVKIVRAISGWDFQRFKHELCHSENCNIMASSHFSSIDHLDMTRKTSCIVVEYGYFIGTTRHHDKGTCHTLTWP